MKRWGVRLLLGLVVGAGVIGVLAWLTVRASLPTLDGEIAAPGITARVSIARDAAGIPTITADNRLDLAFATGFVHGQDRFFQMDLIRRDAAGELSALIGAATIDADRGRRLHRFRARAQKAMRVLDPFEVSVLRSYARGVNAGRSSLGSKPFEYYVLGVEPEDWLPEDSLLVAYAMFLDLNDPLAIRDLQRGLVAQVLPAQVYDWLYPTGSPWDAPLMGEPRAAAAIPGPDIYSLRDAHATQSRFDEHGSAPIPGSNNWAVSGELTSSGLPIVSNDMHLGLSVPNIYYRARLVSTGEPAVDVTGVTLPGQPFVIAGSSGRIAWGFTNSYGDWSDAVILKPGDAPGTYRTPDGERQFDVFNEKIEVKDSEPVTHVVRETIWGPVFEYSALPDTEVAASWIAHATDRSNLGIIQFETAATVEQALDIANRIVMPPQNFVVGDDSGSIGWTVSGQIPARVGYDPMLPADWSATAGWQGWLAAEDYPRIVNPESGRIWTANSRVADGEALRLIGDGGYALGARARQIRDGLFAKNVFVPADMLAIQLDDRALFLAPWQELLLDVLASAPAEDAELAEYRDLVANWIPRAVPESVGYRFVRAFRLEVGNRLFAAMMAPVHEVFGDEVQLRMSNQLEAPLWSVVTERPEHLLPADYESWNEFLLAAVRANISYYKENFDGPLSERNWGEVNTASIRHPLSRAVPLLAEWLDMPADALSGDANLPKAQSPVFGASERFSVYPGDEKNSLLHMPGGQSAHPMSEFYRRGHSDWSEGRATPFLPGDAQYELILEPAAR